MNRETNEKPKAQRHQASGAAARVGCGRGGSSRTCEVLGESVLPAARDGIEHGPHVTWE